MCDGLSLVRYQVQQQFAFRRREQYVHSASADPAGPEIDFQILPDEGMPTDRRRSAGAPQNRANPRQQLRYAERLVT